MSEDEKSPAAWSDVASKSLDVAKELGHFFGMILGPAAKQVGASLGDWCESSSIAGAQGSGADRRGTDDQLSE